jgi:hypothetical protein
LIASDSRITRTREVISLTQKNARIEVRRTPFAMLKIPAEGLSEDQYTHLSSTTTKSPKPIDAGEPPSAGILKISPSQ